MVVVMRTIFITGMLLLVFGCNQAISIDYDKSGHRPDQLKTYKWMAKPAAKPDPRIDTPYLDDLVMTSVDRHLRNKGYTKVQTGVPDFVVSYCAIVEDVVDAGHLNTYLGMFTVGDVDEKTFERTYEKGALVIDMASPGRPELYWRGSAKAAVDTAKPREERDALVEQAIGMILKAFPDQSEFK